jgi:hypothetical protein
MRNNTKLRKLIESGRVDLMPDRMISKKDGTLELRRGFFYRMNMDADKWGVKCLRAIKAAGIDASLVDTEEIWQAWPKDSWFSATIEVGDIE